MATALNLTLKLKQDPATLAQLAGLKQVFASQIQPAIDAVLAESEIVHYARVLVIDDQYIQVITEFDGTPEDYTEFFRVKLPDVFKAIFSLGEGLPPWEELNNRDTFLRESRKLNLISLGEVSPGNTEQGYLFCAYGPTEVKEIKRALNASTPA